MVYSRDQRCVPVVSIDATCSTYVRAERFNNCDRENLLSFAEYFDIVITLCYKVVCTTNHHIQDRGVN